MSVNKIYFVEKSFAFNSRDFDSHIIAGSEKTLINISSELSKNNDLDVKVFNLTKNKIKISNLLFEPGKIILENELSDFLEQYDQGSKIDNWIDFKNFVRKVFVNYYEG